jgi:hypothetical protein
VAYLVDPDWSDADGSSDLVTEKSGGGVSGGCIH